MCAGVTSKKTLLRGEYPAINDYIQTVFGIVNTIDLPGADDRLNPLILDPIPIPLSF